MTQENLTIREATLNDLDTLNQYQQELIKFERPLTATIKRTETEYYNLRDLITNKMANVLVVVDQDKIISTGYALIKKAAAYETPELIGYIGFLYVLPDYRGKGIIKLMVDNLVAWVNARGVHEIQLEVYAKNENAIKAYAKLGFESDLIRMRLTTK